jgi:hypothetical protein
VPLGLLRKSVVLWLLLACFGCRLTPEKMQDPVYDPAAADTAPFLVDETFRIRLQRPGEGWQLLSQEQRIAISGDSSLSAYDTEQALLGDVSVGQAPQASLTAYVDDWLRRLPFSDKSVHWRQGAPFQDCPAESFEVSGVYLGQLTLLQGTFFFHQNHAYRVTIRGPRSQFDHTRVRRFFESITLLPGKILGAARPKGVTAMSGVGWRIRNGRYESALSGLRVVAPPGWQLLAGNELREFNPDADVALIHDDPDLSLTIRVAASHRRHAQGYVSEHQGAHIQNLRVTLTKDTIPLSLMGTRVSLQLGHAEFGSQYAYGNLTHGGQAIELTAGYSELFQAAAPTLLQQAAGHVEVLTEVARIALQDELLAEATDEHIVGRDVSLHSGCFQDYSRCYRWCRPPGFWETAVGAAAQASDSRLALVAQNVQVGLSVRIYAQPLLRDDASLFECLSGEQRLREVPAGALARPSRFSRASAGTVATDRGRLSMTLYGLDHHGGEIAFLASCLDGNDGCKRQADLAVEAFRTESCVQAIEMVGNTFVDRRLGLAQTLPNAFRLNSRQDAFGESGQRISWESPDGNLTLVTMAIANGAGTPIDFIESIDRATRAAVPPAVLRQKRMSTMNVNGEVAQRSSYVGLNFRFDSLLLRHDHVLVAWLLAGRNADRVAELVAGLKWAD